MWHRVWALVIREILTFVNDTRGRATLIVPPLMQLLIFAFAATLDVKNVTMGVLNRDSGEQAIELIERFKGSPTFTKLVYLDSVSAITPFIDNQMGVMVLSIDETFSRNIDSLQPVSVQLILDGRKSNTAQIVAGYAESILTRFNEDVAANKGLPQQNSTLIPLFRYNRNLIYPWYNIPCLTGLITMLVGLVVTSLSVARERELGTFDQLLVSPMTPFEILLGKMIPGIIIGMLEGTLILIIGIFVFQVPFTGSFLYLYFCMFFFICSVVSIGLFLSSLCSTQQQAILGTFIFMTPAVLLSGYATPVENMPNWLQVATNLNPLKFYILVAKGEFLKAMPFHAVWENTWPLMVIALVSAALASWLFRKRIQ